MNRYEKYKDSGIAWIGEIPEKWSVLKLSGLYAVRNEKVSDKDFPALSVTMQGIVPQLATAAKTDDGDNRKLVRIGDFAINSRSDRRGSCGVSAHNGSVSLINTILTPRSEMSSTFYNWLLRTSLFSDEYYKWGHGIVDDLWTTRWQEMKNISVTSPPIAEQEAIAEFLDGKCEEVDRLVGLQQAMIGELVAYKQSVITECVTKGLDHSAPLRDSDIPWIGSIPQHWDNGRLKNIISERLQYGANENGISYSSNLPRYVRITDIIDNELKENIEKQSLPEDVAKDYILKDGDVLFARSGGTVGKSFLYKGDFYKLTI